VVNKREELGKSVLTGILVEVRRQRRIPTRKFIVLATYLREEGEGKQRGGHGVLIGAGVR
jgi:hypothetical protein